MGRQCCTRQILRSWCRENIFLISTIIAIVLGIVLGIGLRRANLSYDTILWIKLWGELFMRMLKLIILPMVMACLIVGKAISFHFFCLNGNKILFLLIWSNLFKCSK